MDIGAALTLILANLRKAIANRVHIRDTELLTRTYYRINRLANRLAALVLKWRAGTLPKPRPSRAGQKRTPAAKPRAKYPTGRSWLSARMAAPDSQGVAVFGSQLAHLIDNDADMQRFLRDVPQAMRYLRPIQHMLGYGPPPPKRSRKPRPARPPRQPRRPVYPQVRPRVWKIAKNPA